MSLCAVPMTDMRLRQLNAVNAVSDTSAAEVSDTQYPGNQYRSTPFAEIGTDKGARWFAPFKGAVVLPAVQISTRFGV
jgi:hypothetical protein